ncbi:MAG: hypothetical protein JWM93_3112, partial [Frankiales bacterium]|nr:hypothetical protein [Frankiales bacterium]
VTVEDGSGGSFGSCAGFTGSLLYSGGLDQLAATHGDPATAMPLGGTGAGDGSRTFRFTTTVLDDNAAQGATAGASFGWGAEPNNPGSGSSPPVTVPVTPTESATPTPSVSASTTPTVRPSHTPSGTPTPSDEPSPTDGAGNGTATPSSTDTGAPTAGSSADPTPTDGSTSAGPTASDTASPSASPTPVPSPTAVPSPGDRPPAASSDSDGSDANTGNILSRAAASTWHAVDKARQVIVKNAPAAIRGGVFGLGSFPFLLLFLLLQRHIDRRDPKLALAPSHADAYLDFDPPNEDGR